MRALALALTLIATPALAQTGLPADPAEFEAGLVDLAERSRQRTVLVYGLIGLGSGGVVSHDGVVVTNAHVVAGARYAIAQWADGSTTLMKRRGIDYGRDLAVLEPAEPLGRWTPAFSIRQERPAEGEWVMAIGFPGGPRGNFDATITVGRVQGKGAAGPQTVGGVLDYADAIVHDAPIFSGNSGGPLVDLEGRFVGVNGAGDLERATSLAIPAQVVLDRLERLTDELILLPGERRFEPRRNPLMRGLYRALDNVARQIPAQTAASARQLMQSVETPPQRELESWSPGPESGGLAEIARASSRQAALRQALVAAGGGVWLGDVPATRVDERHAVCKARRVGNRQTLATDQGQARVLAVSVPDDLALVELPVGLRGEALVPAPHRAPGTLVYVPGAEGVLASGFVSAGRRRTSATLAAQIASGGTPEIVSRLVEGAARLADRLGSAELKELVAQLQKAIQMRKAFSSGTPPHSYPAVVSIDAPLAPGQAGAPALDRHGRLIGVTVGLPHHGTAYVVPLDRVREAFAAQLGGERVPTQRKTAKLY
jgi:S1-C subfamily serine protease